MSYLSRQCTHGKSHLLVEATIIRPRRSVVASAPLSYRPSFVSVLSVGRSASDPLVTSVYCAKTADSIEMPCAVMDQVRRGNHVLAVSPDPPWYRVPAAAE